MKADGTDATTPATLMLLHTYGRLRFPDPTVALRIHKGTPDEVWRLGIESSKLCGGIPKFQNDEVIIPALTDIGLSLEDARNYSIVGCVEPRARAASACLGCTGAESIWNMVNIVLYTINGGLNPRREKRPYPQEALRVRSFDEFKAAFEAQMQYLIDWKCPMPTPSACLQPLLPLHSGLGPYGGLHGKGQGRHQGRSQIQPHGFDGDRHGERGRQPDGDQEALLRR
jgi:formate C-acetyltransferase